ncbi:MAG: DUF5060 domain-containing protein [Fimbriimonadaceae bacterium]|nr:DUF5060 domain-containing protein [Fimbriimonadaceae bacterium]
MLWSSLLALGSLALTAPAWEAAPDGRGVLPHVLLDGQPFLRDLAVTLTAPGWNGDRGAQRKLEPAGVRMTRDGAATVYQAQLQQDDTRTQLELRAVPQPAGLRLEYALTPAAPVAIENILLMGSIPATPHAGQTRFIGVGDEVRQGLLPATLNAAGYRFWDDPSATWLALLDPSGRALRIDVEGLALALQDDRQFGSPAFALHASSGPARTLAAGQTVRFALTVTASSATDVEQAARRAAQRSVSVESLRSTAALRAGAVSVDRAQVPVFERVELTADVSGSWDNPFDPAQVDVSAEVTPPSGPSYRLPGFYYLPYAASQSAGRERLTVAGAASWRVRLTPTVPGVHRVVVSIREARGTATCPPVRFTATASTQPGFVRVSRAAPRYFQYDSGRSYFAVGLNVCWSGGPQPLADFRKWFDGLADQGGNWARLWLANNEKGLEWTPAPTAKPGRGGYLGLGRYALDNAWRLDQILDHAAAREIQLMFCLGTYGELKADAGYFNEGMWVSNPYNAANGGPCAKPEEFFTNPLARQLYQQRLRYLVARWGYSPHLFAWEFWNEYTAPAPWVQEMAAWLQAHDPHRHLVSNTYGTPEVWRLPEVDFTMTHHYGDSGSVPDFSGQFAESSVAHRVYDKPYLVAEFGIDWRTSDSKYDPRGTGRNLHNGLWSCLAAGSAGTGMLWYWDNYVGSKDLWPQFGPVARLAASIDWAQHPFEPLSGVSLRRDSAEAETFSDLLITPGVGWGRTKSDRFVCHADGRVEGGAVGSTLGSPTRHNPGELASSITLQTNHRAPGQFTARLGTVSNNAQLQVLLDGQPLVDEALQTGPAGAGPWKGSRYLEQWQLYQCDYDRDYSIAVPAGEHTIVVRNAAGDWLSLSRLTLSNYRSSRFPPVQALGLRADQVALLWLRHEASTWEADLAAQPPAELRHVQVTIPGLAAGTWRVEWWDTASGTATAGPPVAVQGDLTLSLPPLRHDLAVVLRRVP